MIQALLAAAALSSSAPNYSGLMKALHIPGAVVLLVDHGKIAEERAIGVKNIDTQDPVDMQTRFEIGSITKQFTAAAILQLKDAGKLSLDDKLGKYLPQYAAGRNITLRQMLLQISGIPDYTNEKAFNKMIVERNGRQVLTRNGSLDRVIALIKNAKLDFKPGTKWEYSNSNYYFLGHVVEVASGQPWSSYIASHIFKPAGMTESSFMENEANIADMATGYTIGQKNNVIPTGSFVGWAGGAGTIVSTASDMAKWDDALFSGKVISKADLAVMLTPGPLPALSKDDRYAFGWVLDRYDGQKRIWHNGGTLGFTASNQIYPEQQQAVIVLDNFAGGADELADATFDGAHPQFAAVKNKAVTGEDPAVTARVKLVWDQIVSGKPDRSQLTDAVSKELTPDLLAGVKAQLAPLGEPTLVYQGKSEKNGVTSYTYHCTFKSGVNMLLHMSVNKEGKISSYFFMPQ